MYYHIRCIAYQNDTPNSFTDPWYCHICITNALPFNNILLDDDFHSILAEIFNAHIPMPLEELQSKIFNPFEISENENSPLYDIDPDTHCFAQELSQFHDCSYYTEDMFNTTVGDIDNTDKTPLSLIHANIRSIPQNLTEFTAFLDTLSSKFHIIAMSETWLHKDNADLYNIMDYAKESTERVNKRGGGVAMFISSKLKYSKREDLTSQSSTLESVFIEIDKLQFNAEKNVVIGCIYRPPGTSIERFIEELTDKLETVKRENKLCYLLGDYNINLLNYETHQSTANFVDTMFTYGYIPYINKPTRVGERTATLIDNIFTNNTVGNDTTSGIFYTEITDHFPIFHVTNTRVCTENDQFRTRRYFSAKNVANFTNNLNELNWSEILSPTDPEASFSNFHRVYLEKFEQNFPEKNPQRSNTKINMNG